jgi:aminoacrylate hydrolase
VLVHGLGGTSAGIWRHLADDLAGEFTVVTFDLRGTGSSARPAGPYSLDDLVGDLRSVVQGLALERPALVGHSLGGSIALAYAAR